MKDVLLTVDRLSVVFRDTGLFQGNKTTVAVDDVSFEIPSEPTLVTIVGESGSGKSTLARTILGLQQAASGTVCYRNRDLAGFRRADWHAFRREVQPVFQDPYATYNPFYRIDRVLKVLVRKFALASNDSDAEALIEDALRAVDLRPQDVLGRYPHQLSGGERQRVMLARVYMMKPKLIVADEPISMIDAALRALFLNILLDFRDQGISSIFITHNLATAYYLGGRIMVMCRGRMIEHGDMDQVVLHPSHPYTQLLIDSVPSHNPHHRWQEERSEYAVDASEFVFSEQACVFEARCPHAMDICHHQRPPFVTADTKASQQSACFLYHDAYRPDQA